MLTLKNVTALSLIILLSIIFKLSITKREGHNFIIKREKFITVIDTTIDNDRIKIHWFDTGKIKAEVNNMSDSIVWFPFDEIARQRNHAALLSPKNKKPLKIITTKSLFIFSLVDFKGRAVLFNLNKSPDGKITFNQTNNKNQNPIIKESRYIYVDTYKNLIIATGGRHKLGDDVEDKSYDIYIYKIKNDVIKFERYYKSANKKLVYDLDLDLANLEDANLFFSIIDSEQ